MALMALMALNEWLLNSLARKKMALKIAWQGNNMALTIAQHGNKTAHK